MRVRDRRRHQHVGFVARIAEHEALIARALRLGSLRSTPWAMSGDCLPMQVIRRRSRRRSPFGAVVADLQDRLARQVFEVDQAVVVISPATIAMPVLTSVSHATRARGSCREDGIEHCVGDLVGDLVRVAFGDRLGREEIVLAHAEIPG
jgi:hypothetical protein